MIFFIFHMNNSSHEYMLVEEIGNIIRTPLFIVMSPDCIGMQGERSPDRSGSTKQLKRGINRGAHNTLYLEVSNE